jgi:hypothetical protein
MQEFPHGLPLVQCGFFVSAPPPLRQELIKDLRASPVIPVACALQSFMRCCCGESWALAGVARATVIAIAIAINKRAIGRSSPETETGSLTDHQRHRSTIDPAKPNSARKAVVGSAFLRRFRASFHLAADLLDRSLAIERIKLQCDSLHEIRPRI